jgi:hypothetical protein
MFKNKASKYLLTGGMALTGLIAGLAAMASAQVVSTTTTQAPQAAITSSSSASVDKPESPNDPADTDTGSKAQGHMPLGGDGVITSISGSSIVVGEESDEGGASYTVDASKATLAGKDGAALTLSGLKVGDKIFVEGAVNGTNVSATSISLGHPHEQNDAETNDDANGAQDSGN